MTPKKSNLPPSPIDGYIPLGERIARRRKGKVTRDGTVEEVMEEEMVEEGEDIFLGKTDADVPPEEQDDYVEATQQDDVPTGEKDDIERAQQHDAPSKERDDGDAEASDQNEPAEQHDKEIYYLIRDQIDPVAMITDSKESLPSSYRLPRYSFYLRDDQKEILKSLANYFDVSEYHIVIHAIDLLYASLPSSVKDQVHMLQRILDATKRRRG